MSKEPSYTIVYAVVRIDDYSHASTEADAESGSRITVSAISDVTIKEVLPTLEDAQREVKRLNALNADKGCRYSWQSTHWYPQGR